MSSLTHLSRAPESSSVCRRTGQGTSANGSFGLSLTRVDLSPLLIRPSRKEVQPRDGKEAGVQEILLTTAVAVRGIGAFLERKLRINTFHYSLVDIVAYTLVTGWYEFGSYQIRKGKKRTGAHWRLGLSENESEPIIGLMVSLLGDGHDEAGTVAWGRGRNVCVRRNGSRSCRG